MDLVRDLLDNRVLDRNGEPLGRVDGIVLELRDGLPPRVSDLELGGMAPVRRLRRPVRSIAAWFVRRWGMMHGEPYRIPWSRVQDVGIDVDVDLDAREVPVLVWERRAREAIIEHIPGGG